eukprot:TRINITY_DN1194_c0_g2_i1.p1 TRINITY_DN1194_c0_g2~~TRINITY_DN1194_c0_g2_i1.p1  ORF type:complete len:1206 (-),score=168.93 TRINITY_DN1194_c0_g2_i1:68-3685(-)
MEVTTQSVDLIDDIWRKIFTGLGYSLRAKIFRVCKRWQTILSNPLCWTDLDVQFEDNSNVKAASLSRFILKYCYLASKVNIEVSSCREWEALFQSLFSLPRLRYLRFLVGPSSWGVMSNQKMSHVIPNWSNMVYLNLGSAAEDMLSPPVLELVLEGTPNLEELYLHRYSLSMENKWTMLKPLRKLKFLSVMETRIGGFGQSALDPAPDVIIAQVPHLQTLILYRHEMSGNLAGNFGFNFGQPPQPTQPICEHYGNTLVVSTDMLRSRELETVKKIGPLLKMTNYAHYFASQMSPNGVLQPQEFDLELLDYLFKELKLDINCNTYNTVNHNPFVADLFKVPYSFVMCPLFSAISNVDQVRKMLDLGADPNGSHEDSSPFALSLVTKESCLLLLERGADPLKKMHEGPAVAKLFELQNLGDEDLSEVMQVMLKKGVDPNLIVAREKTLLDLAIKHQYRETALALLDHGARWTANAMDLLITWNKQWWQEVIESGAFDTNKLYLSTALLAVKHELPHLVHGYLLNYTRELDSHGYSLVHYISLLPFIDIRVQGATPKNKIGNSTVFSFGASANSAVETAPTTARVWAAPRKVSPTIIRRRSEKVEKSEPLTSESILIGKLIKELGFNVNLKSAKGETPLLLVCEHVRDDPATVSVLINSGANVNEADSNGWTPLHAALYLHKYETAKELLSHGANINAQDKLGITPAMAFVLSAKRASEETKDMFAHDILSGGIDVTITDKYMSRSLLHYVCCLQNDTLLETLIDKVPGLDINRRDAHGFTPLHYAALEGAEITMKCLIKHGADKNAVSHALKLTPMAMMLASENPLSAYHLYTKSYSTLRETSALTFTTSLGPEDHQVEFITVRVPSWLSDRPDKAIKYKQTTDSASPSIPVPSDLSIKDRFGNNVLHEIARSLKHLGTMLLESTKVFPAALHDLWSVPNRMGTTPFHVYAKHTYTNPEFGEDEAELVLLKVLGYPQIVDSLNSPDEHGKTGLEYVLQRHGHRSPVSERVKSALYQIEGFEFTTTTIETRTSFPHYAIENEALDKVMLGKIALSDPSSLNQKINGKTPLMLYMEKLFTRRTLDPSWVEIFDTFLALKVDLNVQDTHGDTALHHACYFFHLGGCDHQFMHDSHLFSLILFKLLDAGAAVNVKNNSGQTPVDIIPNLLELDRSLVHRVKIEPVETFRARRKKVNVAAAKSTRSKKSYKF